MYMKNSFIQNKNTQNPSIPMPNSGEGGAMGPESRSPVAPLPNPGEGGPVSPDNGNNRPVTPLPNPGEGGPVSPGSGNNRPVTPLPNPGEGGPVSPGNGNNRPVTPLPNPGEGGPVYPGPGNGSNRPVNPLPNPGEGGPVYPGPGNGSNRPVVPLPNPGEGGPVEPGNGSNRPVIPLPNPGEGGPVYPGPDNNWPGINIPSIIGTIITTYPRPNAPCIFCTRPDQTFGNVRFLNAAANYNPFRIYVNDQLFANSLGFSEVTDYEKVPNGYQIVTVMGDNQYIYIQKPVMVPRDGSITIAICNTETGLDLFVVSDNACNKNNYVSCIRVCNLSFNSGPLSVVIGNNDVRFMNVDYQEVTNYRIIMPAEYVFYVMNGNRTILLSSTIDIKVDASYTMYIFNWNISSPDALRVLIIEEH